MKKALPLTITLGSLLLLFCIALTALWNYILIRNYSKIKLISESETSFQLVILIIGSIFFVIVITGIILFIVFLARQIVLNQLQNNFIDNVTHELKTPLTSIKLYVETMKKHDIAKEKREVFLNTMLKDIERLDILVNHVLEATRIENINKEYQNKQVSISSLIDECIEIICRRYNLEKEIFSCNYQLEELNSIPTLLEVVILNLLDNAIKYSTDNIKIEIKTYIKNNKNIISIKDHGVGINKNEFKQIFKRFYRIPVKITKEKKGTGLGLFIVKENIKKLKGNIEAQSKGINQGSEFIITLP